MGLGIWCLDIQLLHGLFEAISNSVFYMSVQLQHQITINPELSMAPFRSFPSRLLLRTVHPRNSNVIPGCNEQYDNQANNAAPKPNS